MVSVKTPETVEFERLSKTLHTCMTEIFLHYFWKNSIVDVWQGP